VAVAKPNLKPMKISASSPTVTTPPTHSFALAAASSSARAGSVLRLPEMMATAIRANAISPAGISPATNRPPIDRLATKPRMIRLMQGGMVSAITAEAASSATAPPSFCLERRAAGISTEPTAATSAIFQPEMPEKMTMLSTMTRFRPPRMRPTMRSSNSIRRTDMPFASIR